MFTTSSGALDVSSTCVEQLMCVAALVKLNAEGDAVRHLLIAEAFFGRTDAINFVFTCKYASATHSKSGRALQGCVAANSPGAMRHIFPETRRASLKVLACIVGLQIALVRRSASRASLRHACNESSLDWTGEEHRPRRVYTRAHGHTDKQGQENRGPLAVNERVWKPSAFIGLVKGAH